MYTGGRELLLVKGEDTRTAFNVADTLLKDTDNLPGGICVCICVCASVACTRVPVYLPACLSVCVCLCVLVLGEVTEVCLQGAAQG